MSNQPKLIAYVVSDSICQSVAHTVINLDINSIITPTESGSTARMVSKYRPKAPIVAVTSHEKVRNQLNLVWGVYPQLGSQASSTDEMLDISVSAALQSDIVKYGDTVVITAGVRNSYSRTALVPPRDLPAPNLFSINSYR